MAQGGGGRTIHSMGVVVGREGEGTDGPGGWGKNNTLHGCCGWEGGRELGHKWPRGGGGRTIHSMSVVVGREGES